MVSRSSLLLSLIGAVALLGCSDSGGDGGDTGGATGGKAGGSGGSAGGSGGSAGPQGGAGSGGTGEAGSGGSGKAGSGGTGEAGSGGSGKAGSGGTGEAGSGGSGKAGSGGTGAAGSGGSGKAGSGGGTAGAGGSPGGAGAGGSTGGAGAGGSTGGAGASGGAGAGGTAGKGGSAGTAGAGGAAGQGGAAGGGAAGAGGQTALKKFVGNITTNGRVRDDFAKYWDQITPENEGKWSSVEGTRGKMNWGSLDTIYKYTKDNNIIFKQHTFVWGSQQPTWVGGLSTTEQAAEVEDWIKQFCERYPDVPVIDVVNEPPPHTTPPYMQALGGAGSTGYDWVATAFTWARKYCPKATLILNDYNVLSWGSSIGTIAKALKSKNLIDALGSQSHGQEKQALSDLKSKFDTLKAVGLPIYITEYDLAIADDNEQKRVMAEQFPLFYTDPQVKGITLWGYIMGATWVQNSGLIQTNGTLRPAMTWLMDYLKR